MNELGVEMGVEMDVNGRVMGLKVNADAEERQRVAMMDDFILLIVGSVVSMSVAVVCMN